MCLNIDESYESYYNGPVSDHFDGERFFNPWNPRPKKGLWDVFKWRMQGGRAEWPETLDVPPRPALETNPGGMKVTYLGHATFLVQVRGKTGLIDPVFSERCSPFRSIGPKRVSPPFLPMEKLPKIDFVFVSHNHYDHLDLPSLSWLASHHQPAIFTPLGNARLIKPCTGSCAITSMDWHDTSALGDGLEITAVPAQHWSRRSFGDINRDLWAGCYIRDTISGASVFYTGDSGFDRRLFEEIARRHGTPSIALVPIGAYEPRWFMRYSHMNPAEAVEVFRIMNARKGIGFHFETFQLTDEAIDAPRKTTLALLEKNGISAKDFLIPYPGDSVTA